MKLIQSNNLSEFILTSWGFCCWNLNQQSVAVCSDLCYTILAILCDLDTNRASNIKHLHPPVLSFSNSCINQHCAAVVAARWNEGRTNWCCHWTKDTLDNKISGHDKSHIMMSVGVVFGKMRIWYKRWGLNPNALRLRREGNERKCLKMQRLQSIREWHRNRLQSQA